MNGSHEGPPVSVGVATSEAAAESLPPGWRSATHRRIVTLLRLYGPLCCRELARRLDLGENTVRPRLCELEAGCVIEKCDGKQGRPLMTLKVAVRGRPMLAYRLTPRREEG